MKILILRSVSLLAVLAIGFLSIIATGGGGGGTSGGGEEPPADGLPPDPATIAPPLTASRTNSFLEATAFLYSASNPVQTGVADGTIKERRVAVLKGRVMDRNGEPLSGVTIRVLRHAEFGKTLSRTDGRFDLAVNGGGWLTLDYSKNGYLTAQRRMQVPWRDYVPAEDVVLVALDPAVTRVDLSTPGMKVAQGSQVSDNDGERRATLLVPEGVSAQAVMADGSRRNLDTLDIRLTEFTVGESGPKAMPAKLPPASAYTYALEYSVDQALDAARIEFSQPLVHYNEDFIGFEVGSVVPVGYYDRQEGRWVASDNGRVVKLLAIEHGLAVLDTDGDEAADDATALAALGVSDTERQQLAGLYAAGQTLWRVPVSHFTPSDLNWPYQPPDDAVAPPEGPPDPGGDPVADHCEETGSIIECQNQVLAEQLPVSGTPFSLNYTSARQEGYGASRTINIPLTGKIIPASLISVTVTINIAGRQFEHDAALLPNQVYRFVWDGKDAYGRTLYGQQPYTVKLRYVYPAIYAKSNAEAERAFARASGGGRALVQRARSAAIMFAVQTWQGMLENHDLQVSRGLGGWMLDVRHRYNAEAGLLLLGDGSSRRADIRWPQFVAEFIAGGWEITPDPSNDFPLAGDKVKLNDARDFAIAADGSIYFTMVNQFNLYRITPEGKVELFSSDALMAESDDAYSLNEALAFGPDGQLYLAQWGMRNVAAGSWARSFQILRFNNNGQAEAVYGYGPGYDTDFPTYSSFSQPQRRNDMLVAPDGSIYFTDARDLFATQGRDHQVFQLSPDGNVEVFAGDGSSLCAQLQTCGDNGPAMLAQLPYPTRLAMDEEGNLYILSGGSFNSRIRRVAADGTISTVLGCINSPCGDADEGIAALSTRFIASQMAVSPQGRIAFISPTLRVGSHEKAYVITETGKLRWVAGAATTDAEQAGFATQLFIGGNGGTQFLAWDNNEEMVLAHFRQDTVLAIDRLSLASAIYHGNEFYVPSDDGKQVYVFDVYGRHLRTHHALTGAALYRFAYDANGFLSTITDGRGNVTRIERQSDGTPLSIVSPEGQLTTLSLGTDGYLESITADDGAEYRFTYSNDGMISDSTDPEEYARHYEYNDMGLLSLAEEPNGGFNRFTRETLSDGNGFAVVRTTAEGRVTRYRIERLDNGMRRVTTRFPDATETSLEVHPDGSRILRLADGGVINSLPGPDPRWGMQAPLAKRVTYSSPDGLQTSVQQSRSLVRTVGGGLLDIDSQTTTLSINGNEHISVYNNGDRSITLTTAEGRQSRLVLTETGEIASMAAGSFAPVEFEYDTAGRLTGSRQGSLPDLRQISLSYDDAGRLDSVSSRSGRARYYEYNAAGQATGIRWSDGRRVDIETDLLGNLTALSTPANHRHTLAYSPTSHLSLYQPPNTVTGDETRYTYNLDDQRTRVELAGEGALNIGFDTAGRQDSIQGPLGTASLQYDATSGKPLSSTSIYGVSQSFRFDGSLMVEENWSGPFSGRIRYTLDDRQEVIGTQINDEPRINFLLDADSLGLSAGAMSITRDTGTGLLTGTSLGALQTTRSFNNLGELESIETGFNNSTLFSLSFSRDEDGGIVEITENMAGQSATYAYTYDAAGRLAEVQRNGSTVASYQYDDDGNRTGVIDSAGNRTASFDSRDRLLSQGSVSYEYDSAGRRSARIEASQRTEYEYDLRGALHRVSLADGRHIDYLMDATGRRVGKEVDGTLVQGFLYKDDKILAELDASGQILNRFIYIDARSVPVYFIRGGVNYRLFTDHLGSVRAVINASTGAVVQRLDYDAFGRVLSDSNPGFQPFGFAGGLYDPDTGLLRFGLRDYDPEAGRWTAADPSRFAGGSTNLYAYVGNDPVNFNDPSGLSPEGGCAFKVTRIGGDVRIHPDPCGKGSQPSIMGDPVEMGQELKTGDVVETGEHSRLELKFSDNSVIRLGSHQSLRLNDELCIGSGASHSGSRWIQRKVYSWVKSLFGDNGAPSNIRTVADVRG